LEVEDMEGKLLYEGKAKRVYATENPDEVLISYKDSATAFDGLKKGTITGKGRVNNLMSAAMFGYLEHRGIATHFVRLISETEMIVKHVKIVPLEVVVRNVVAGSLSKRLGIPEGVDIKEPIREIYYKDDELHDPLVNDDHVRLLGVADQKTVDTVRNMATEINSLLRPLMLSRGLILVDFKLEFGFYGEQIILADEISPDTCRFWDSETREKLDKDRFRRDLGGVEEAYEEVLRRISGGAIK
jgi:phosphoribosylaminoimidazole-succinocarboxamide synthase